MSLFVDDPSQLSPPDPARVEPGKAGRLIASMMLLVVLSYGCRTTNPAPAPATELMRGVASWYGEEFAGRTTANGEIFDPALLTAAHRTLPFGTVLDVTNVQTKQTVRVRVNDRGPYIGGRVLDLSYAAAQQIGLIEPGIGEVELALVKVGSGDREPPVPFEAVVAVSPATAPATPIVPSQAPAPQARSAAEPPNVEPVVVDRIEVQTQRGGVTTRTQVAADGRTLEEVPVDGGPGRAIPSNPRPARVPAPARPASTSVAPRKQFIVQVGAFSQEANARALQERLAAIGQTAHVDYQSLYRVRLGPFATRDEAAATRATLEANGLSAIIVSE
jgi:rare lipoprotein A